MVVPGWTTHPGQVGSTKSGGLLDASGKDPVKNPNFASQIIFQFLVERFGRQEAISPLQLADALQA
jgi:hypothetical protein